MRQEIDIDRLDHWIERLSERRKRLAQRRGTETAIGQEARAAATERVGGRSSLLDAGPLVVAYLGPEGTFSHAAAQRQFGAFARLVPAPSIAATFEKLASGDADFVVLPLVNSVAGPVVDTFDNLASQHRYIVGDLHARIDHCLVAPMAATLAEIDCVFSHPHALSQCRRWLATHLPGVRLLATESTSAGIQQALARPASAAVGSRRAARLYGLSVIAQNIQDEPDNSTRFVIVGDLRPPPTGDDRTTFVIDMGAGHRLPLPLEQPDGAGIIRRLAVRPGRSPGSLLHFFDALGHESDPDVQGVLATCRLAGRWVRVLGSYQAGMVVGDTVP